MSSKLNIVEFFTKFNFFLYLFILHYIVVLLFINTFLLGLEHEPLNVGCSNDRLLLLRHYSLVVFLDVE